jgi:hypothetical protein
VRSSENTRSLDKWKNSCRVNSRDRTVIITDLVGEINTNIKQRKSILACLSARKYKPVIAVIPLFSINQPNAYIKRLILHSMTLL